mmetsp:Transcript_46272/g.82175  ORF Transcript_46272/g.82175 Transcript_46272/m.82175 type:complete len:822 (+) Transcript_46272:164-2629(+)
MGCEQCKQALSPVVNETPEDLGDHLNGKLNALVMPAEDTDQVSSPEQTDKFELDLIQKVELFKCLPLEELPIIAKRCAKEHWQKGATLIKQGDTGSTLFVISKGMCSVFVDDQEVAGLSVGDFFGESSLLRDDPCSSTIVADTPVSALKITRELFEQLGLPDKVEVTERHAVVAGAARVVATKPPSPKTAEEKELIKKALKTNERLQTFARLNEGMMQKMADVAWKESVKAGTKIIKEGDLDADYFYIVQEGLFEASVAASSSNGHSAEAVVALRNSGNAFLGVLAPGQSFGELALLYLAPRAATVKAQVDSVVWVIDRNNFKEIMQNANADNAKQYIKYLENLDAFKPLDQKCKIEVAKALVECSFTKDEVIFEQGEAGDIFYVLLEGEVSLVRNKKEAKRLTAMPEKAQFFGERALLKNEPRKATAKVVSDSAKALSLDNDSFQMLLKSYPEASDANRMSSAWSAAYSKPWEDAASLVRSSQTSMTSFSALNDQPPVKMQDLTKLGVLGTGGFGLVDLVEHNKTGKTYALKTVSKGYIVKCGMQTGIMQEKHIHFMMAHSRFIIKLYDTYNGDQSVYFLLEAALGGELYRTYKKKRFAGSEDHARFYVAGVTIALDHLHKEKVMYRDLKPENVMLSETGHVKLTDMGLAKVCPGKTYTTCGTPEYFAPEVITATGYTCATDWWALGVFLFELMAGKTPFEAPQPMAIYTKVFKGIQAVDIPECMLGDCVDLVKGLLVQTASQRLPMKKGGTKLLKDHRFFEDFDWKAMEDLTLEPPYVPEVKNKKDLSNFKRDTPHKMPKQLAYTDDGSGWDAEFATSY